MKLTIHMEMPKETKYGKPKTTEQKVREAIDLINSGHESKIEWRFLNSLYAKLKAMPKKTDRIHNLMDMIEPVLAKHGMHGVYEKRN